MDLPLPADRWDINRLTEERTAAVGAFGFTPRQARFLVEVLIHSGIFVERQYCRFAGITHGQKTTDFLHRLVERGCARSIATGAPHRGRLFHLHHKPLCAAIEQTDNRHRKPMAMGRMVERLMILLRSSDAGSARYVSSSSSSLCHTSGVAGKIANASTRRDRLDVGEIANELEVHADGILACSRPVEVDGVFTQSYSAASPVL